MNELDLLSQIGLNENIYMILFTTVSGEYSSILKNFEGHLYGFAVAQEKSGDVGCGLYWSSSFCGDWSVG